MTAVRDCLIILSLFRCFVKGEFDHFADFHILLRVIIQEPPLLPHAPAHRLLRAVKIADYFGKTTHHPLNSEGNSVVIPLHHRHRRECT